MIVLDKEVDAIFDPGSDLHLARSSFYVWLGTPPFDSRIVSFVSVGTNQGSTVGSFDADVIVNGISIKLKIHVVLDDFIPHVIMIGGELSNLVEVRLKKGQVRCLELDASD